MTFSLIVQIVNANKKYPGPSLASSVSYQLSIVVLDQSIISKFDVQKIRLSLMIC